MMKTQRDVCRLSAALLLSACASVHPQEREASNRFPIEHTLHVDGTAIHLLEWPKRDAETVLLVPGIGGGGGSAWQFAPFAQSAQMLYRVLVVEPRGFAESARAADYSWHRFVEELDALLRDHALARVRLVGHSFGTRIVALYAALHPERVSHLVLVDGGVIQAMDAQPPTSLTRGFASIDEAHTFAKTRWGTAASVDDAVRKWMEHGLIADSAGRLVWRIDPRLREEFRISLPAERELRETVAQIRAPTLIIRGALSTFSLALASGEAAAIPGARVMEVPGAGHVVHLANPKAFNETLLAFFGDPADK